MAKRLEKSMVDYVTIAISPMLIMLLVGSLMFFLLETVFSSAQYGGMLKWTMFWFVIAIVLISRIGIEQGTAYASGYGLALAAAVWLVAAKYTNAMVAPAVVLGIVWWFANKLTWDCTLIEDTEDASGEGLLQVAGMAESTDDTALSETKPDEAKPKLDAEPEAVETRGEPTPWWQRILLQRSERKNKPHAPGLWVVYFSMAALPLFGVGQLLLNSSDEAANDRVFQYLGTYVAAGLALLMTTSFLGLRRYLRQRKLEMPNSMVTKWLGMGAALIVAVLLIAMLIPRPQADYSITALLEKVGPEGLSASDYAMLPFDSGDGEGNAIGDPIYDGSQPDSGGSEGSGGESSGGKGDPKGPGGSKSGEGGAKSGGKSGKGGSEGSGKSGKGSEKGSNSEGKTGNDSTAGHDMESSSNEPTDNPDYSGESPSGDESQAGHESGEGQPEDGQSGQNQSSSDSSVISKVAGGIAGLVKWLIYIAIFVVFCLLVKNNWAALSHGVKDFINRLKAFWASLFGGKSEQRQTESMEADGTAEAGPTRKRFASYQNPFSTGEARNMDPEELITYTFEAFESWSTERGVKRPPELTPIEYAKEVGEQELDVAKDAGRTALLYTREAYSNHRPPRNYAETLERLWRAMG